MKMLLVDFLSSGLNRYDLGLAERTNSKYVKCAHLFHIETAGTATREVCGHSERDVIWQIDHFRSYLLNGLHLKKHLRSCGSITTD